ncbi:Sensor histidine kinase ComP [compost metagenome]
MMHKFKITVFIALISILVGYLSFSILRHPIIGADVALDSNGQYVVTDSPEGYWGFGRIMVGDIVKEINGQPTAEFYSVKTFSAIEGASSLLLSREGNNGEVQDIILDVDKLLPSNELMIELILPLTAVLVFSGLSILVYRSKKGDQAAFQLIMFFMSIGIAYLSSFSSGRADPIGRMSLSFFFVMVPIFFIQFMNRYLDRYQEKFVNRALMVFFYVITSIQIVLELSNLTLNNISKGIIPTFELVYFALINVYIIYKLIEKFVVHRRGPLRSLFKLTLVGHLIGFFPFLLLFAVPQLFRITFLPPEIPAIFLLTIPIVYLYMFTTKQLFDIDFLINRFLYYATLSFFPTLLISMLAAFIMSQDNYSWIKWGQLFLVSYLLITLFLFVKEYADRRLRPRINKDLHNYQGSLNRFSTQISRVMKRSDLERVLEQEIYHVLPVRKVAFLDIHMGQLQQPSLDESLLDIRDSIVSSLQGAAQQLSIGKIIPADRGICIIIGIKGSVFHVLWLDDKESRTKFNTDERAWLKTLANYSAIVYENLYLIESLIEDLEEEFQKQKGTSAAPWVLRLIFKLSEKERRKLASDLHDSALQDQLIWYRKLEAAMSDHEMSQDLQQKLLDIREGLLDVIHQIRETCNELRPPLLQEMGIVEALRSLFEQSQIRSNYIVDFRVDDFTVDLNDEQMLTIFRIVQELLRNAGKHAKASNIMISLEQKTGIRLTYKDDGVGLKLEDLNDSYQHMGLSGIKERVHSLEGRIDFKSEMGNGLEVSIFLPLESSTMDRESEDGIDDSNIAG